MRFVGLLKGVLAPMKLKLSKRHQIGLLTLSIGGVLIIAAWIFLPRPYFELLLLLGVILTILAVPLTG